jgi:hypothetical protein
MDTELNEYKILKIREITNEYNNNVTLTNRQFINFINYINRQRISPIRKRAFINIIRQQYFRRLQFLRNNYTYNISYINSLTDIPGRRNSPSKFALLVGINYKNTPNQLYGCINDVNNIQNLLKSKYEYNNFVLLTDETNVKPTRQNILNELTNMFKNSIAGDCLFFLFSGHGSQILDTSGDEDDGMDELIVSIDNFAITDDEIRAIINNYLKPDVKLFALFDSCHSGTAMDLRFNYTELTNSPIINEKLPETNGQVIMISGCKDDQTSIDASIIDNNGKITNSGAMTFSFLKTLELNNYQNITYKLLVQTMRNILVEAQLTQIPQLSSGKLINVETDIVTI